MPKTQRNTDDHAAPGVIIGALCAFLFCHALRSWISMLL
jgi:hypothetical protein